MRAALPLPAAPQARERPLWGRGGQAAGEQGSREASKQESKQAVRLQAGYHHLARRRNRPAVLWPCVCRGGIRAGRRVPASCAVPLPPDIVRRGAGSSWRAALCGVGCERIELGTVRRRQLLNMSLLPLYLLGLLLSSGQGRSGILFLFYFYFFKLLLFFHSP